MSAIPLLPHDFMPVIRLVALATAVVIIAACSKASGSADGTAGADSTTASADNGGSTASNVNLPVVAEEVTDGDLVLSVNTTGQVLAPGYALDVGAGGFVGFTFNASTYPGLQALHDRAFDAKQAFRS